MITPTQQKYLDLLRCGLWDMECGTKVNYDIFRIAIQQSTTALVLKNSKSEAAINELKSVAWSHDYLNAVIVKVTDLLESHGIRSVLLKGQGCAENYPQPLLRNCGDIDLYVGEAEFDRACGIVAGLEEIVDREKISQHHRSFAYNGVIVEIHRWCLDLTSESRQKAIESLAADGLSGNLPTILISGREIKVPEVTFNAAFVFSHMVHHLVTSGIGFRQVCDWVMLLHAKRDVIDRERLGHMLDTLRFRKTWELFGHIAVHYLGLPKEEMPFYREVPIRKVETTLKKIFQDGNFGRAKERPFLNRLHNSRFFLTRKILATAIYTLDFLQKSIMFPELMTFSGLLGIYATGFRSTFSRFTAKKRKN